MKKNPDLDNPILPIKEVKLLLALLVIASGLLIVGLILPMMTITKLVMFSNSFSVLSAVLELLENGQVLLFMIVAGFSIVVPILKIGVLFKLILNRSGNSALVNRLLHLMHEYGRWAMLDVLVVAILIVAVKLGCDRQYRSSLWLVCFWYFDTINNVHNPSGRKPDQQSKLTLADIRNMFTILTP